ncbi:hypothetical protein [Sphingobacterium lactis]|uniref:hypothetical protein n=1 Tax=Sphingobacterium lactis TaxID=797291 RepID=UPI003DA2DF17
MEIQEAVLTIGMMVMLIMRFFRGVARCAMVFVMVVMSHDKPHGKHQNADP